MNTPLTTQDSKIVAPEPKQPLLTVRDIVLMVTLSVTFGFLYWVLVQAWFTLQVVLGPAGDLSQHFLFGGWLLVAPLAIAIIRRPGVGIIAEVVASVVEVVFLGSPVGPLLFIAAAIQGFGSELPFALTRYRKFTWPVYALSGLFGAGLVFFYSAARSGWYGQDIFWLRFGIQCVSGILLGGLLALVIINALRRTGVLNNFAIIREGHLINTPARRRTASAQPDTASANAPELKNEDLT